MTVLSNGFAVAGPVLYFFTDICI